MTLSMDGSLTTASALPTLTIASAFGELARSGKLPRSVRTQPFVIYQDGFDSKTFAGVTVLHQVDVGVTASLLCDITPSTRNAFFRSPEASIDVRVISLRDVGSGAMTTPLKSSSVPCRRKSPRITG